jgi:chromosome segregation protein
MYLKSIKANGFKSFADKVNIELQDNITCIVGPNGSGKSNIVDAVRWVLGEQSVKSLRGTNAMSDIIFAGSKTRNSSSRAEVSLTFDNSDHYLNSDLSEIEVKRVLYHNGESDYFINNSHVRLKDITDLFLDSGAGNDSFNIISQGKIEAVVNSKPIERRVIFEEAAGVLKYKKRKEESQKKLERTKENIDKVNLIIEELQVTLNPLKEQSENAKKYLDLKDELKNIEISLIVDDITNINQEYSKIKTDIDEIKENIMEIDTKSSDEASKLEMLKLKSIKLEEEINNTSNKLLQVTSKFVNLQN